MDSRVHKRISGTQEATGVSISAGDATVHTRVHAGHRC